MNHVYLIITKHFEAKKFATEVAMNKKLSQHHSTEHRQQPHQHLQTNISTITNSLLKLADAGNYKNAMKSQV